MGKTYSSSSFAASSPLPTIWGLRLVGDCREPRRKVTHSRVPIPSWIFLMSFNCEKGNT